MSAENDTYPERVKGGLQEQSPVYQRLHGQDAAPTELARPLSPKAGPSGREAVPAYSLGPGAPPAFPSGLVLVRFAEGVRAMDRAREIGEAGYAVARELPLAPHAVLIQADTGRAADALSRLEALERLPDVANVEPQMVSERSKR